MLANRKRIEPGPGQESVWDYPRPPRLERVSERLRVDFAGETVAESTKGLRVLETSRPPVFFIPPEDVRQDFLRPARGQSWCEFKGRARYWSVVVGPARADRAAWSYANPTAAFRAIANWLAFDASCMQACWVGAERAYAQSGDFYGGWITSRIVGPFKTSSSMFG